MMKNVNVKMAVLSLLMALVMLVGVIAGASMMTTASAAAILPETEYVSPKSPTAPTPYDGVPVTPGKISSSNYRFYGLTDENWQQYNGYYAIRNAKELYGFAALTRAMRRPNHNAVLLADIVINTTVSTETGGTYLWESIVNDPTHGNGGGYAGTFDGNGYSISGIYMTSDSFGMSTNFGFFGAINNEGVVKNLVLKNSVFLSTGSIAVFAHNHYGMVSACRVESSVILKNEISGTRVSGVASIKRWAQNGNTYIGGIENTYSAATLQVIEAEYVGVIAGEVASSNNLKNNYGVESNGFKLIGSTIYQTGKVTTLTSQNDAHVCTPIVHNQVNGTCYSSGLSAYTFCAVCEKVLSGEKTVLYGHSTTETFYTPNKTDNSKHDERCAECTEIIGENNHDFGADVNYTCLDCEFSFITKHPSVANYVLNQESFTLTQDLWIAGTFVIPEGTTLIIPEGIEFAVSILENNGTIINNGAALVKGKTYGGSGTVICGENATHHPAFNNDGFCAFCGDEEYPEAAPLVDGYYQIGNAGQLMWFAKHVNAGNANANAVLTNDIVYNEGDLSGLGGKTDGYRFWTPIGMIMNHETGIDHFVTYTGTFDGQGYSISGLYHFDYWSYAGNAGLISKLGAGGVIRNVTVKNSYFATSSYAGAILGQNLGGTVENCHNVNTTVASAARVGGIVGDNTSGTIKYSTNKGNVKFFMVNPDLAFDFSEFGGIAGNTTGTIEYCTNYGDITSSTTIGGVGGIAGQIYQGTVKNCVNDGDINVSGGTNFGGITGYQYHGTLSYNINYGTIVGGNLAGGIIGNPLGNGGRYTQNYTVGGKACGAGERDDCLVITEAELANGRLAFELGIGQELGKDARPSVGAPAVYAYFNESGVVNYTNNANYTCHHKGGTATCNEKAVCDGCRNPYGEIPVGAHEFQITGREDMDHCLVCGGRCGVVAPHSTNYTDYCAVCGDWIAPELSEDGFYEITTFGNLIWFAEKVNEGNYALNARLMKSIYCDVTFRNYQWVPIGGSSVSDTSVGYEGIFDGQGYALSLFPEDILVEGDAVIGLFGTLKSGAIVKNLSISNRQDNYLSSAGTNYTYNGEYTLYFGLVAGRVLEGATVSGCRVANSTVSISKGVLGAIVGVNYGTVENCVSYGLTLTGPMGRTGGIVGDYNGGTVTNCYTTYASIGSTATGFVGTSVSCEAGISDERMASGEIAYKMNSYLGDNDFWYQPIGKGGPLVKSETDHIGKIVYLHNFGDIIFYSNNEFKVVINSDYTIPAGKTILIPSGITLEIAKNITLTNEGTLIANGILTGKGTLAGNGAFQISDLDVDDITVPADFTFDGIDHYNAVVEGLESGLVIMGKTLSIVGYIRTLDFTSIKNVGEYTVTYTAEHETLTYRFAVKVLEVSDSDVSLKTTTFDYNSRAHEPLAVLAGMEIELGRDYYVSYSNNVSAGEATATITFRGNLSGEFTKSFTILPVAIGAKASVAYANELFFTGIALDPITVSVGDIQLVRGVDYTVTLENNIYPGTATAKVVGIGSVSGEVTISFEILKPVFTVTVFDQILPYNEDSNIKPFDQTMYEGEGLVEGHIVVLGEPIVSGGTDEMISVLHILDANGVDVLEYYDLTVLQTGKYHMFYENYRWNNDGYHWRECVYNCDEKIDYEEHHGGVATCSENGVCVDCGITYLWATGVHTYENGVCTGCDYNPEYVLVLDQDGNGQHSGVEQGLRADSIHNIFYRTDRQYVVVKDFEGGFAGVGQENTTVVLDLFGHTIDMTNAPYGFSMQANNLVVIFKSTAQDGGTLIGKTIVLFDSIEFTLDNVRHEGTLNNKGTIYVQNGALLCSEITNNGIIYLPEGYDLSTIVSYQGGGTLYVGELAFVYNEESGKLECATDHIWGDADCTTAKTCSRCGATDGDPLGHETDGPATCEEDEYCTRCESVITEALGHTWDDATCTDPKTCSVCGTTEGEALGHAWDDATCTDPKTCSVCGATEGEVLGHTWDDATCTDPKTCSVCGTTEGEALGHTWDGATCTSPKTCSVCGATEGEALGHTWDDATCTDPKTCSVCGATEGTALGHTWYDATCTDPKTCSVCGATEGEALGHTWNDATCTDPKTCSVCGTTEGEALGHTWDDATCTDPKTCSVCGATEGEALGHTWDDATCTDPKTCSVCGTTEGEALGHTWDDATCTSPKTCSVCGATEGEALGHTWDDATCTDPKICSVCGATEGEALGHTWDDATCTDPKTCSVCGTTEGEELGHTWDDATCTDPKTCSVCGTTEGEALGHTWDGATCTDPKTCSVCGTTEGDALGHTWDDATCTDPKTCSVCGATEGEALGHTWDDATCTDPKTCSVCGATEGEALGHTWDDATCTSPKTCSVCGATEGESLGHTWNDATCTSLKTCSVCGEETGELAEHVDASQDGKCDACGYQMTVPEETTPEVPEETTTEVPEETTTEVPEETTPEVPEETTPEVPEETTPELPEGTTPEVPEETTPELPEETTPELPEETTPNQPEEEPQKGLSNGAVAGIVVGSTAVAGAGGFSVFWFVIKKKRFSDLLNVIRK